MKIRQSCGPASCSRYANILVFGNPLVKEDSIALRVAEKLKEKFEFKILDAAEDIENEGKNLVILDCADGIEKTELIGDLGKLQTNKIYSMHDFDIALTLKLLKKIGKIESVKVIAIPKNYELEKALKETEKIIKTKLETQNRNPE